MSSPVVLAVLGLLGLSMGLPVEDTLAYNPQDFYAPNLVSDIDGSRIVGGSEAAPGSAWYMIALMIGEHIRSLVCGGSVVSRRRVVTAAHCIDPLRSWWDGQLLPTARGQVGSHSLSGGYTLVRFSGHANHPEWNPWIIKFDVGVLELAEPLEWTAAVRPVSLDLGWVGGGEVIEVYGWGRLSNDVIIVNQTRNDHTAWGVLPDRLQWLRVRSLSPEQCEKGVQEANQLWGPSPPVHPHVEICTMHDKGQGFGLCNGDSGSALTRRGKQVALVSWGWACALGHPDVHTRLHGVKDWLKAKLGKELGDAQEW